MSDRHKVSTNTSSGRAPSAQPFHLRRQQGSSTVEEQSPSSDSDLSQEIKAPPTNSLSQATQRPSSMSFANRHIQRHQSQRSSNMVSFQFPTSHSMHSRAPENAAQQGHGRGASRQGSTRRNFHNQGQTEVIHAPTLPYTIAQASVQFQSKLTELRQLVNRNEDIPRPFRDQFNETLRKVAQDFDVSQRQLQAEWDSRANRYDQLSRELEDARQEIGSVVEDRARISSERDALQLKISELRLQHKSSTSRLSELEQKWQEKYDILTEKLRLQDEQLKGKRALWLNSNPASSARRDAMTSLRDPFNSPTRVGQEAAGMQRMKVQFSEEHSSKAFTDASGFGTSNMYQPLQGSKGLGLPFGKAVRPSDPYPPLSKTRHITTEPGDTPLNPIFDPPAPSTALILREDYTDPCPPFQQALEELLVACEHWVKQFTSKPSPANDRLIAQSNQMLWDYMMNCTYPGERQNAHSHVTALLNDPKTRYWFVMRMIVGYFVNDVLSIHAFQNFDTRTDAAIAFVKQSLEERGLANERRQVLIDQQCDAIRAMVDSSRFHEFRRNQLNRHTRSLREMLGPMLNEGCERAAAGREIGDIAVKAWELSVKMYTSNLTFQIFFPETCTKFTSAIMNSRDHPNENPNTLQTKQIRTKLVITPIITLRDDRSTTIRVKNLLHSDVLLMA